MATVLERDDTTPFVDADIENILIRAVALGAPQCAVSKKNTSSRWRVEDAVTGRVIAKSVRNPFCDAARALVAEGRNLDAMLYLVPGRQSNAAHWRLRAPLGEAAMLTVSEPDHGRHPPMLVPYRAFEVDLGE